MCYVLYMASERVRPSIKWDDAHPAFYVSSDDLDCIRAKEQFKKQSVHYLGSDNGCGCGFQRENDWLNDDPKERESKRENQRRLAAYITECLHDEESVELYGCWSGDEGASPVRHREIGVGELLAEQFFFIEKEHVTVRKTANQTLVTTAMTHPSSATPPAPLSHL